MTLPPSPEGAAPDFQKAREALAQLHVDGVVEQPPQADCVMSLFAILDAAEALVASQSSEIAELRQDAERWRAVRDDLAVDGTYLRGYWRIVGNEYEPYPGPSPANIDEAADLLASRASGTTPDA